MKRSKKPEKHRARRATRATKRMAKVAAAKSYTKKTKQRKQRRGRTATGVSEEQAPQKAVKARQSTTSTGAGNALPSKDPSTVTAEPTGEGTLPGAQVQRLPHRTDAGNAELFAAILKNDVRFDHARKRWLLWLGHWWGEDVDGRILNLAKKTVRRRLDIAGRVADERQLDEEVRWCFKSESRVRLEAMLKLAESERLIADDGKHWDEDPWLLGVTNGVVSLRTGQLLPGGRLDRITMHTRVSYDPEAKAPRWEKFLNEIFEGDQELIDYVQRAVGYSLTGATKEQCFFIVWGLGSNGKTVFLLVLLEVLGDYGHNMPFSSLELTSRTAIPNDMAALTGRRLVTASETNELAIWNEQRVKVLTGEDAVTARFLYREYFTFSPVAKFWLAFNHKPVVTDDTFGFWRRVRLIPFRHKFEGAQADKDLVKRLRSEAPGILAWAVRGCLKWQEQGLGMPKAVEEATQEYRAETDVVGQFIEDCCVVHPRASVTAKALWDDFQIWCEDNGEQLDRRTFANRLQGKGFAKRRVGHDRIRM